MTTDIYATEESSSTKRAPHDLSSDEPEPRPIRAHEFMRSMTTDYEHVLVEVDDTTAPFRHVGVRCAKCGSLEVLYAYTEEGLGWAVRETPASVATAEGVATDADEWRAGLSICELCGSGHGVRLDGPVRILTAEAWREYTEHRAAEGEPA